jgi:hypothetical protein
MKDTSRSLLLGLWRSAMYAPSMCPDIERGEVAQVMKKVLKAEGVTEEEFKHNPYAVEYKRPRLKKKDRRRAEKFLSGKLS